MRDRIVRPSGMRQGIGLAVAVIGLAGFYVVNASPSWRAGTMATSMLALLIGTGSLVWAAEEHLRGNKMFTALFSTIGLVGIGVGVRGILLSVSA
jgi:hypothetical protein